MNPSIMEWGREKSTQQAITAFHDYRARTGPTGKAQDRSEAPQ
jgi:hypothetical protein